MTKAQSQTAKKPRRKPASFRVEDVEIVMPPEPAPLPDEPETEAEVMGLPKLERGLRWGSIFLGALGGLIGLLASLWLYDYVLALIARDDWIGWVAVVLLGLVLVALLMIILRELVGLMRLGRLDKIRHEADSAARQNDKPLAMDVTRRLKRFYRGREDLAWGMQRLAEHEHDIMDAEEERRLKFEALRLNMVITFLCGGYPHQLLAFGYSKLIYGTPSPRRIEGKAAKVDEEHSAESLENLKEH